MLDLAMLVRSRTGILELASGIWRRFTSVDGGLAGVSEACQNELLGYRF